MSQQYSAHCTFPRFLSAPSAYHVFPRGVILLDYPEEGRGKLRRKFDTCTIIYIVSSQTPGVFIYDICNWTEYSAASVVSVPNSCSSAVGTEITVLGSVIDQTPLQRLLQERLLVVTSWRSALDPCNTDVRIIWVFQCSSADCLHYVSISYVEKKCNVCRF